MSSERGDAARPWQRSRVLGVSGQLMALWYWAAFTLPVLLPVLLPAGLPQGLYGQVHLSAHTPEL